MARAPIFGAGGIVVRDGDEPLIAIVQRRKDDEWVLPKGKLKRDESAVAAAEREVMEETGQDVVVGEFLGAVSYRVGRRPKVVQFWRMQAYDRPARKLAKDIKAVRWLPLEAAIRKLTDPLEQVFLRNVSERNFAASAAEQGASAEPRQPVQPTALTLSIDEQPHAAIPSVSNEPRPRAAPADSHSEPIAMRSTEGRIAVLPDPVRPEPSAVGTPAPRPILGVRPAPPAAATKPVARLNWLDRILHRLWPDRKNAS
jgi:8-oxo-dGTP diphosphatase